MAVNIDADDQTIIACNKCDYKCRLNIQLKKHTTKKHPSESKYNCNEYGFETNYVANTWEHTLEQHPDKSFEFTPKEAENFILKLVAEQNANIVEEIGGLKMDIQGAFEQLVKVVDTQVSSIKEDTNDKCKLMADTIMKLYG